MLVFLALAIILYWLLELGGVPFIQPATPFFNAIKGFTHLFYTRTSVIAGAEIDFSFLIASITFLLIVWGLKSIINVIENVEKSYDKFYKKFRKRTEEKFNVELEQQYVAQEQKNNNFLILISFCLENLSKDKFFNKDVDEELDEKIEELLDTLLHNVESSMKCKKEVIDNNLLLYFNDFNKIEEVLFSLEKIFFSLKYKYQAQKWEINSIVSIDVYANRSELDSTINKLKSLNKLGLKDKILCLSTFKQRYSLVKNPRYFIESQSLYAIIDNEEVFWIKRLS